jgi:hypothetical protein
MTSGSDDSSEYRQAARLLIDTYGADAWPRVIARSRELLAQGDMIGYAIWEMVLRAMDAQQGGPNDS